MKSNIVLVSLVDDYAKRISKKLADRLDMFFVDAKGLINYDITSNIKLPKKDQENYLLKLERRTIKSISCYENTIIDAKFDILNRPENLKMLKQSGIVVYLRFSYKTYSNYLKRENINKNLVTLNSITFEDRDSQIKNNADIVVDVNKVSSLAIIEDIMKSISKYYG